MAKSFSFDALNTNSRAHREAAEILRLRRVDGLSAITLPAGAGRDEGSALLARYGIGEVVMPRRYADDNTPRFVFA